MKTIAVAAALAILAAAAPASAQTTVSVAGSTFEMKGDGPLRINVIRQGDRLVAREVTDTPTPAPIGTVPHHLQHPGLTAAEIAAGPCTGIPTPKASAPE